jgi:hypothetical protein
MTILVAAVSPEISGFAIVHGTATAQCKYAATIRANGFLWGLGRGFDSLTVRSFCKFHDLSLSLNCINGIPASPFHFFY